MPDATSSSAHEPTAPRKESWTRSSWALPTIVFVVGLLVTVALALISLVLYNNNENRLLRLRSREVGAVLTEALPGRQTQLAAAAELADATNGNVARFKRYVGPDVGPTSGKLVSFSLWRLDAPQQGPVAVVGSAPKLAPASPMTASYFARAAKTPSLSVVGLLGAPDARIGYAFAAPASGGGFLTYAESALPTDRRSRVASNSAFSDLNYVVYLGNSTATSNLLVTSISHLPVTTAHATEVVPFGDQSLTLVLTARGSLAGALPQQLPWIIGIAGVLLTLGATVLTMRLVERRRGAERLADELEVAAGENRRLYAEQRDIAQTLQHALLPDAMPSIDGLEASARYEAGEEGVEIGGDWYDVIALDGRRLLLVVGDVSGRGLRAATTMASLRFAIHAYAAQNDPPATILTKLSNLVSVAESGQLATVLCALVDVEGHQLTITSAGHLPPLLITGDDGKFVESAIGLPIGIETGATYSSTTVAAPPGSTFLAFTDGLVERRGESLDVGLTRLRDAAMSNHAELAELIGRVVSELHGTDAQDDTAIVGVRWTS